jgi:CRISPR/Cas system-associated exonuclease Cas4 (RecB family)
VVSVLDTVLMNRLDGDAAGPVKVLVSNPLYSHDHQHVIIPEGTIVLGEAKKIGSAGLGQQRRMEYKRGKSKPTDCDTVQLCAQALCLEEMLTTAIPRGAIFYGNPRRRQEVVFTPELRARTEELAATMHRLYRNRETPPAKPGAYCSSCSLVHVCLPQVTAQQDGAARWVERQVRTLEQEG